MSYRIMIIIILSLICIPIFIFAIVSAQDVIIIKNADRLIGRIIDGENVRELVGNVTLEHKDIIVNSDTAIYYPASNRADLYGNVEIIDDTVIVKLDRGFYDGELGIFEGEGNVKLDDGIMMLTADYGKYHIESKEAIFWENVVVIDTPGIVFADHLVHNRESGISIASGNVRVYDAQNESVVYGELLEYDNNTGNSIMKESPLLIRIDSTDVDKIDTLIVKGTTMESYRDTLRHFITKGDVEITYTNLAARGERADYYIDDDQLSLTGSPILWYGNHQVSGDSIHITLMDQQLRSLYVHERAFAISKTGEIYIDRFNQLTGDILEMYFQDEKLEKVIVSNQATSLYYFFENGDPSGVNIISADTINISFLEGEIDELRWIGGVEGKHFPEILISEKESEYNLPGFNWIEDRPFIEIPYIEDKTKTERVENL